MFADYSNSRHYYIIFYHSCRMEKWIVFLIGVVSTSVDPEDAVSVTNIRITYMQLTVPKCCR